MILPDNIWKSKVIRRRLAQEAGFESANYGFPAKQHYWFLVPDVDSRRSNIELKNFTPSFMDIEPHEMQKELARQLRSALQQHEHRDGLWIVGWTHPPSSGSVIRVDGDNAWYRLVMIWLDADADPQFTLESDLPFAEIVDAGLEHYLSRAAEAFERFNEMYGAKALKEDMGLKESQKTKEVLASIH